jgi:hypothetical protein
MDARTGLLVGCGRPTVGWSWCTRGLWRDGVTVHWTKERHANGNQLSTLLVVIYAWRACCVKSSGTVFNFPKFDSFCMKLCAVWNGTKQLPRMGGGVGAGSLRPLCKELCENHSPKIDDDTGHRGKGQRRQACSCFASAKAYQVPVRQILAIACFARVKQWACLVYTTSKYEFHTKPM